MNSVKLNTKVNCVTHLKINIWFYSCWNLFSNKAAPWSFANRFSNHRAIFLQVTWGNQYGMCAFGLCSNAKLLEIWFVATYQCPQSRKQNGPLSVQAALIWPDRLLFSFLPATPCRADSHVFAVQLWSRVMLKMMSVQTPIVCSSTLLGQKGELGTPYRRVPTKGDSMGMLIGTLSNFW